MRLLDRVDRQPLCRVWQEELVDDFYLIIGRSDGSESLGHVVVDQDKRMNASTTAEGIESGKIIER